MHVPPSFTALNASRAFLKSRLLPVRSHQNKYPLTCGNCSFVNPIDHQFCTNCGFPMLPNKDTQSVYTTRLKRRKAIKLSCTVRLLQARNALYIIATLLMFGLFFHPGILQAQTDDTAREKALDAFIEKGMKDWKLPGLSAVVVKDGKVVYLKGFGIRTLGDTAAVDADTQFGMMSTTKAMTALSIAMLVDEGKIRWDDPVTKHLPWFQMPTPNER